MNDLQYRKVNAQHDGKASVVYVYLISLRMTLNDCYFEEGCIRSGLFALHKCHCAALEKWQFHSFLHTNRNPVGIVCLQDAILNPTFFLHIDIVRRYTDWTVQLILE